MRMLALEMHQVANEQLLGPIDLLISIDSRQDKAAHQYLHN